MPVDEDVEVLNAGHESFQCREDALWRHAD